jgi:hypothetical protein
VRPHEVIGILPVVEDHRRVEAVFGTPQDAASISASTPTPTFPAALWPTCCSSTATRSPTSMSGADPETKHEGHVKDGAVLKNTV